MNCRTKHGEQLRKQEEEISTKRRKPVMSWSLNSPFCSLFHTRKLSWLCTWWLSWLLVLHYDHCGRRAGSQRAKIIDWSMYFIVLMIEAMRVNARRISRKRCEYHALDPSSWLPSSSRLPSSSWLPPSPWKSVTLFKGVPKRGLRQPLCVARLWSCSMNGCVIKAVNDTILVAVKCHSLNESSHCFLSALFLRNTCLKVSSNPASQPPVVATQLKRTAGSPCFIQRKSSALGFEVTTWGCFTDTLHTLAWHLYYRRFVREVKRVVM